MATQQQEQQQDTPQQRKQRIKHIPWIRLGVAFVAFVVVFVVGYLFVIGLLNIQASIILAFISIIIGLFQWLFPISTSKHEQSVTHTHASPTPPVLPTAQPIIVQVPATQSLVVQSPPSDKPSHRGIVGLLPPTDSRTIQQRENVVKEVYTKLTQPGITAIALTGIGGAGKSTLAALVYRNAEEQRRTHTSPFQAETLWLTVDPAVTFADLAGNLFEALGKPLPELSNLAPQNQAVALFNGLNTTDKPRLVILDQFENLLDWDTGHALTDRPGVGEWLDITNSQQCACRVLLTSRPRPVGTREYPPTYLQEYPIGGLEVQEGVALLQSQGVQGIEAEFQTAVTRCAGHALSLTLLATLMRDHHLDLPALFKNSALWTGDIATNLLDQIFTQKLNDAQRELLLAFSVYREPVPVEAVLAIITSASETQISPALKALVTQHLLEAVGEGRYQLHAIVGDYAQERFDVGNEQANKKALKSAHVRAAQYYLEQVLKNCPPREKRLRVADVHDLIEAVWQYCQAEQWQEAYGLMEQEGIFEDLKRWGGNAVLLELYQLLLPLEKWKPEQSKVALIYTNLGRIHYALGKKEEALEYHKKALAIFSESGDLHGEGVSLNYLGRVYNSVGRHEEALRYYEEALRVSKGAVIHVGEGRILNNIGRIYDTYGRKKEALRFFEEALDILRDVGDREGEGKTLHSLGWVYDDMGQVEEAEKYFEMALQTLSEIGHRGEVGKVLCNLGWVYERLGKSEMAHRYFEESLSIVRMVGSRSWEGIALSYLGRMYVSQGNSEEALSCYTKALDILREVKDRTWEGITLSHLGIIYNSLGKIGQALSCYTEALHILRDVGDRWEEAITLYNISTLYLGQHSNDIALAFILVAKLILEDLEHPLRNETQNCIEAIHRELGDEQFAALLATVEPQAQQIVDQALREGLE